MDPSDRYYVPRSAADRLASPGGTSEAGEKSSVRFVQRRPMTQGGKMNIRSVAVAALAATGLVLTSGVLPAYAHHSFAMFDQNTTSQLTGTLKDVSWTNPHTAMIVVVPGADGQTAEWHFESGPPAFMLRAGLKRDDLSSRIGSKVTVTFHPLKDGRTGGSLVGMKFEDGASWKL
jgi:hypothetical protein